MDYCINCGVDLTLLGPDEPNDKCAKCRAEENHDFDKEPNAEYNKYGYRVSDRPSNVEYLKIHIDKLKGLLDNPECGCFTWHEAYEKRKRIILDFWENGKRH